MSTIFDLLDPATGMLKGGVQGVPGAPNYNPFQPRSSAPAGGGQPGSQVGRGAQPGGFSIPGYTPDYKSLIENDPYLRQFRADLSAEGISDASQRDAAFRRAAVQFGEVPGQEQFGSLGLNADQFNAILDPTTRQLAQQNTESGLSIKARLEKAHKDRVRQIKNYLASRGALRSGETGYQLSEAQQQFTQGHYDARQQILDYLAGVQRALVESERARQRQLAAETQRTAERYANDPQYQPTPGVEATPDPEPAPSYQASYTGPMVGQSRDPYIAELMRRARDQRAGLE